MKSLLAALITALSLPALAQDAAALIRQGDAHDARYETEEALRCYLPAEKAAPQNASLLVKIARQYVYRISRLETQAQKLESGRTALAYAERAVKADAKNCEAWLAVAIASGRLAQLQGVKEKVAASRRIKEAAEKAIQLDPGHDYGWHILGRWHQGIAGANRLILNVVGLVYGEIPEASHEEAEACFKKALALRPDRLLHHIELGRTYAQMGRKEEARSWLEKGLAMPNRDKDDAETKERGRKALAAL